MGGSERNTLTWVTTAGSSTVGGGQNCTVITGLQSEQNSAKAILV